MRNATAILAAILLATAGCSAADAAGGKLVPRVEARDAESLSILNPAAPFRPIKARIVIILSTSLPLDKPGLYALGLKTVD